MARHIKQLVYGLIFFIIFALIATGIYFRWFRSAATCFDGIKNQGEVGIDCGGPCAKMCMPADFKELDLSSPEIFKTPGQVNVLVQIKNHNQSLAARKVDYTLKLLDENGNELESHPGSFYVYAGQIRFMTDFIETNNAAKVSSAAIKIEEPDWIAAADFPAPQISVLDKNVSETSSSVRVSGHIKNSDLVALDKVTVLVILHGAYGEIDGVSETNFDGIDFGATLPFAVSHPAITGLAPGRTETYVYAMHP